MSNDEAMNQVCDMFSYIDRINTHDLKEAQRLMKGERALLSWVEMKVDGDWDEVEDTTND